MCLPFKGTERKTESYLLVRLLANFLVFQFQIPFNEYNCTSRTFFRFPFANISS